MPEQLVKTDVAPATSSVAQSISTGPARDGAIGGDPSGPKAEEAPVTEPAANPEGGPVGTPDPTSPSGDIRHVIAALRGSGEAEQAAHAATTNAPSAPAAPAPSIPGVQPIPPRSTVAARDRRAATGPSPRARMSSTFGARYELRLAGIGAAIIVAALLAGLGISLLRPSVYAARADLIFPIDQDRSSGFLREDRRLLTHVEQIRNWANLEPVASNEGVKLADLEKNLNVSVVGGSEIIRVEVRDTDPDRALGFVTSIVDGYIAFITDNGPNRAKTMLQKDLSVAQDRIKQITVRLAEISPIIANTADAGASQRAAREAAQLELEAGSLYTRVGDLEGQLDAIEVNDALQLVTPIIATPHLLSDRVSPRTAFDVAIAGVMGAIVATAAVGFLWWRRTADFANG